MLNQLAHKCLNELFNVKNIFFQKIVDDKISIESSNKKKNTFYSNNSFQTKRRQFFTEGFDLKNCRRKRKYIALESRRYISDVARFDQTSKCLFRDVCFSYFRRQLQKRR